MRYLPCTFSLQVAFAPAADIQFTHMALDFVVPICPPAPEPPITEFLRNAGWPANAGVITCRPQSPLCLSVVRAGLVKTAALPSGVVQDIVL